MSTALKVQQWHRTTGPIVRIVSTVYLMITLALLKCLLHEICARAKALYPPFGHTNK